MNNKICPECQEEKPLESFKYASSRGYTICNKCRYSKKDREKLNKNNFERSYKQKQRAVELLGNKCANCGIVEKVLVCIYDFHHIDPKEKDFNLGTLIAERAWKYVEEELYKCILLCSNCHRKLHFTEKHPEFAII